MKLYRIMRIGTDGKPVEGVRRSMLGVRPTDPANTDPRRVADVQAANDGDVVAAGTKQGLSVYAERAEAESGVTAKDRLWQIESEELEGYSLVPASDPLPDDDASSHHILEPSREMTLAAFQAALRSTRDLWEPVT